MPRLAVVELLNGHNRARREEIDWRAGGVPQALCDSCGLIEALIRHAHLGEGCAAEEAREVVGDTSQLAGLGDGSRLCLRHGRVGVNELGIPFGEERFLCGESRGELPQLLLAAPQLLTDIVELALAVELQLT